MADHRCAVGVQDGLAAGDTRAHHLWSTGEAGEEVRLDEADDNPFRRPDVLRIEPDLPAERGPAHQDQFILRVAVMIHHPVTTQYLGSQHLR